MSLLIALLLMHCHKIFEPLQCYKKVSKVETTARVRILKPLVLIQIL